MTAADGVIGTHKIASASSSLRVGVAGVVEPALIAGESLIAPDPAHSPVRLNADPLQIGPVRARAALEAGQHVQVREVVIGEQRPAVLGEEQVGAAKPGTRGRRRSSKRGWTFDRPSAMANSRTRVARSRIEQRLLQ